MYPRPQSIWTVLDGRQQLVKNMVIVPQNRPEQPIIGILALLSKTAKVLMFFSLFDFVFSDRCST